ncbi:MAG: FAD-binding oxidoreductase [Gemmatimonadaceae bacterium]|nr:FAD-binding oxidoreductase [Chitinophagaceae bacterium]
MFEPSIWEKETFYGPRDIIIVGSGLSGLWSAYHLKKLRPSANILILERGLIPSGASTRNAGFACFGSLTELMDDAATMGEKKMLELVSMRFEGLQRIKKLFTKKEIGLEKLGGFELISNSQYADERVLQFDIDRINRLLRKITKKEKTFRISQKKLRRFSFGQSAFLVENKLEAQLHSGKLLQALVQLVQSMGVQIMTQVNVSSFKKINNKVELTTNIPVTFTTAQLLICTNAFAADLLPKIDVIPARGQVLVTSAIADLPFRGCFHHDEGFYYFRNLGDRVLLGGARNSDIENERSHDALVTPGIQQALEDFLQKVVLPGRDFTITDRWAGIMGMGGEKMPVIRKIKKNIYCAVRMSGMGVALAPVAGEEIALLMCRD